MDETDDVMGEFAKALTESASAPKQETASSLLVSDGEIAVADPQSAIDALLADTDSKTAEPPAAAEAPPEAPADPFGVLDTDKMLAEVASLEVSSASGTAGDNSSVLDEQIDTDRLMNEMGLSETPPAPSAASQAIAALKAPLPQESAAAPAQAPTATPAASAAAPVMSDAPVDDLLAEFKDTDFKTGKETKGTP